ncbi:General negative regulator of transcription subunit 3 [Wickerhamomyces ciferrii]|uniref:General negative regulator of transcription subunit n=1 Tax=Wickerhamomyces ciferrii (strain ATCC 14091 / BCRC 22168 / CBS 111 / JCM 3599 / NBRC 0793 / NRRL Y-1031 F-60-10) TaxID=1206466 RepID=K0KHM3_WICCF|nr:General negative regulator of transcription subunit 3 [Wickerhamomyces ciferrii]CCH40663.1 General negative regulator of transcription subunit 3 [Wickerhamomyces ciferrii]
MSSNPSQREKLESDLKREIKKLQKLREQIKVWQTQNEVKDKEKLLEYRRLVEVAMEKYKVVEKGSKVKAYSNMSLKQGTDLDPEEKEKLETIQFIEESIENLENQYQSVEAEVDKLSSKKSKKQASANESKKEELKEFQERYRWHQQNLEIALRLLENDELQVSDILEIKEELTYYLESNRDSNFIENEYIYESLDLESNELSNEVVSSLSQIQEEKEAKEAKEKELKEKSISPRPGSNASPSGLTPKKPLVETPKSKKFATLSTGTPTSAAATSSTQPGSSSFPSVIGSSTASTSTLKPAITPVKPASEMKWSALAAAGLPPTSQDSNVNVNSSPSGGNEVVSNSGTTSVPTTTTSNVGSTTTPNVSKVVPSSSSSNESPVKSSTIESDSQKSNAATIFDKNVIIQSNSNTPPINELEFQQDSELINLPPGIQDIITSFVSCRKLNYNNQESIKTISNVSNLLEVPKDHLKNKISSSITNSSLELLRVSNFWNLTRLQMTGSNYMNFLGNLDDGILFYAFYYGITPFENFIVEQELIKRNWRSDLIKKNWYQLISLSQIQSQSNSTDFQIGNFKKFDAEKWNLIDLINHKLNLKTLTPLV